MKYVYTFILVSLMLIIPLPAWALGNPPISRGQVKNLIEFYAGVYGVQDDIPLLYRIAFCESGFDPYSININKGGSKDFGTFQINSVHTDNALKKGYDITQFPQNIDYGIRLYVRYGSSPWKASSKCWQDVKTDSYI